MSDKFTLDDILNEYSNKKIQGNSDNPVKAETESDAAENVVLTEGANDAALKETDAEGTVMPVIDKSDSSDKDEAVTYQEEKAYETSNASIEEAVPVIEEAQPLNAVKSDQAEKIDDKADQIEHTTPLKKINSVKQRHIERVKQEEKLAEIDKEKAINAEKRRESIRNAENAAAIANLMKLKKERGSVRKKQHVTPVNRPNVKDIDLGLTGKIIPKTEEFDKAVEIPEDATFEEKTRILYQQRKKKIDNFRLKTFDELSSKNSDNKKSSKNSGQKEFEKYEEAPKILKDILQVKNNLIIRLCVLLFTGIFSLVIALANDFEWPMINAFDRSLNPSAFVFVNTILGIISIAASYTVLSEGVKNLFKRNADCDSVAAVGIFISIITGIIMLFSPESIRDGFFHMYMSVSILGLLFNTLGKLLIVRRTEKNFRFAAGEYDRYALMNVDNEDVASKFTKGSLNDFPELAAMRKTEFVEDFMKNSYSSDISDQFAKKTTPLILIAGVFIALLSLIFDKNASGAVEKTFVMLAALSGTVSLCSSMVLMLVVNVPLSRASKKYLHYSAVMLGYSSVEEFADTNSVLVDAQQLFPNGMVDFVNLKLLSSTMIEECILMAASLACQANSVLKPTFYKMLRGKTEMLYPVESYIYEDGLGLSGWIENKRVLLGTRELMENHSIEGIPTLAKEKEYSKGNIVMYLSISGVVSTLFVLKASPSLSVARWLQELEAEGITTVVRTVDGFINLNFLSELFDVNPTSIKLLPFRYHEDYENETEYLPRVSSSMLCSGHFPSFAMLVIGAKRLKVVSHLGIAMQFGSLALGGLIALIMMALGAFTQITASLVLLYQLIFGAFTMIVQYIIKRP